MGPSPYTCVLTTPGDARAERIARALGAVMVARPRELVRARPDVVIARVRVEGLGAVAAWSTLAGARAVIAAPSGTPRALPWWGRRYHRFLCESQEEARAWASVGVAIGRIVVVPAAEEALGLASVIEEVRSMAGRRDTRHAAR